MFTRFFLPLTTTINNMRASAARTILTILGIVIGIASVTIVMSAGQSAQNLIIDQISGIGSDLLVILPGTAEEDAMPSQLLGIVTTTLTNADVEALRTPAVAPDIIAIAGYVTGSAIANYQDRVNTVTYQGVSSDIVRIENITVASGRFFTAEEDARLSRVAVIGSSQAQTLFDERDPIGQKITIGDKKFLIVGVLAPRGALGFTNPDDTIYIPLLTAQKQLLGINYLSVARMKVKSAQNIDQTKKDVKALLRARHDIRSGDPDDFSVRDLASALTMVTGITDVVKMFLVLVAAISLVVGGIGVMNVMFIVLAQRLREIGLRKALGATRGDIALQFLIEAIIVATIGGIIGIILGVSVTLLIATAVQYVGYNWTLIITWDAIGIALGISIAIGIVFGMYPAYRASRVSPIEALRYE